MAELTEPLTIDVVSDVVCPWCYIGKRRLEAALAERGSAPKAVVRWHPFQLNPDLPLGGVNRRSYLENKFGGPERIQEVQARIEAAGRDAGIWFEFERIDRQPNTLNAHRLIAWAQSTRPHVAGDLVESLFRAYFTQGIDIGNIDELAHIAGAAGLDAFRAKSMLASGEGRATVAAADQRARAMGINGVPLFIFNQRLAVSGAQPARVLLEAMTRSEVATVTR
ncbi:MAG TPA: DsbA family oxidoreductase [Burkholderiaceae bacterium]|nr:DsbA family oxidoreductase [Burkholderiaceae bacterium]HQR69609.1 DsbA family oxidoreductase [Burkholderiaceae bacterium]